MPDSDFVAHVRRDLDGNWQVHSLEEHLNMVIQLGPHHATGFVSADWAYMAGGWRHHSLSH